MTSKLTIGIIAGNEQAMISDCLTSCLWADEIVLVAANSTDTTKSLAKKIIPKIRIYETSDDYNRNFSKWRNLVYHHTTTPWLLYIDADERLSPQLKKEVLKTINSSDTKSYYVIPRANHFLGRRVRYGGTYPDYVKRLYRMADFKGYRGILHEEPRVTGDFGYLKNDLVHYTHRDLTSMLNKSIVWTDTQAQALLQSNHPPVVWWRFLRMMLTKLWERLIYGQMWRDGTVGWISAVFESFDTFMVYARLWELQQDKPHRQYKKR